MLKFKTSNRAMLLSCGAVLLLAACGGGGSSADVNSTPIAVNPPAPAPTPAPTPPPTPAPTPTPVSEAGVLTDGLFKNTFQNDFKIGAAISSYQIDNGNINSDINGVLAEAQYNSLTPSFQLKADVIAPTEGVYDFEQADILVDWAIANGMDIRGHTLVWHESTPDYFYEGTPEEIRARLEDYVTTVVEHFKGRIGTWDVVNEVVSVDIFRGDGMGVGPDRRSRWYEAVGSADYIDWAFHAARAADPDALLFINEYSTENAIKKPWLLEILQRLQDRGVPVDGVGHQFHLHLQSDPVELLQAIDDVDNQFMGLINHVTELDMDYYSDPGTCWASMTNCDPDLGPVPPADMEAAHARILRDVYAGLRERPSVTSVTTWGVTDNVSWLNRSPTERYNYPLLFDREGEPKPAFWAIVDPDYVIPTGE